MALIVDGTAISNVTLDGVSYDKLTLDGVLFLDSGANPDFSVKFSVWSPSELSASARLSLIFSDLGSSYRLNTLRVSDDDKLRVALYDTVTGDSSFSLNLLQAGVVLNFTILNGGYEEYNIALPAGSYNKIFADKFNDVIDNNKP